jgi:hypothetical protein
MTSSRTIGADAGRLRPVAGRSPRTPDSGAGVLSALAHAARTPARSARSPARERPNERGSTPAPPSPPSLTSTMRYRLVMVAVALAVAACERPSPATPPAATPPSAALATTPARSTAGLAGSFTDVHVLAEGADATFFYKTTRRLPIAPPSAPRCRLSGTNMSAADWQTLAGHGSVSFPKSRRMRRRALRSGWTNPASGAPTRRAW